MGLDEKSVNQFIKEIIKYRRHDKLFLKRIKVRGTYFIYKHIAWPFLNFASAHAIYYWEENPNLLLEVGVPVNKPDMTRKQLREYYYYHEFHLIGPIKNGEQSLMSTGLYFISDWFRNRKLIPINDVYHMLKMTEGKKCFEEAENDGRFGIFNRPHNRSNYLLGLIYFKYEIKSTMRDKYEFARRYPEILHETLDFLGFKDQRKKKEVNFAIRLSDALPEVDISYQHFVRLDKHSYALVDFVITSPNLKRVVLIEFDETFHDVRSHIDNIRKNKIKEIVKQVYPKGKFIRVKENAEESFFQQRLPVLKEWLAT